MLPPSAAGSVPPISDGIILEKIASNEQLIEAYARGLDNIQILLGVFAVLITVLIIYLGFKVEKSAIKAATDEAISQLAQAQERIEGCVTKAEAASTKAERLLIDLEGHKELAASHLEKIRRMERDVHESNPKKRVG